MDWLAHPAFQALLAGMGSWLSVSIGACVIFFRREFSRRAMDMLLGGAGGMMLGAAFWGLLTPAIDLSAHMGKLAFLPPLLGLALGTVFLWGLDLVLPHIHALQNRAEGPSTSWTRSILLVLAMALHHIPEGLAMGVGYGAAGLAASIAAVTGGGPDAGMLMHGAESLSITTALMVTFSIMLQNLPEGLIVAAVLRSEGFSARVSCLYGVLSGITAPVGAVLGALTAHATVQLLPVALAFAAGAMLYVVAEEVIPEANASGHGNAATAACIGGVAVVICMNTLMR